jgi:transcriptional regulator with XRE-family HTH domain
MDLRRVLARNVRTYRLAAKLTQEELAGRMGMDQYYVSGLEAGRRNPTLDTVSAAAKALGVKPSDLLDEQSKPLGKRKGRKS